MLQIYDYDPPTTFWFDATYPPKQCCLKSKTEWITGRVGISPGFSQAWRWFGLKQLPSAAHRETRIKHVIHYVTLHVWIFKSMLDTVTLAILFTWFSSVHVWFYIFGKVSSFGPAYNMAVAKRGVDAWTSWAWEIYPCALLKHSLRVGIEKGFTDIDPVLPF